MGKQGLFHSMFVCFLAVILGACTGAPASTPYVGVQECPSGSVAPNLYAVTPEPWILDIYTHADLENNPVQSVQYKQARSAAFKALQYQTERWSDFVDIQLSDTINVRITITYLSPQLIETVLLNDDLLNWFKLEDHKPFPEIINNGLKKPQTRDESIFLVTISTTKYMDSYNSEPVNVDIPLENLILTNSSNQSVHTKRDDHSVEQYIRLNRGAFSAIVSFQMTALNGNECRLLLAPYDNNVISIHLEGLKVNGSDKGPQTWTIRYEALLNETHPRFKPDYSFDETQSIPSYWGPSNDAPTPVAGIAPTATGMWDQYWQKLACYIWAQVTFDGAP